MKRCAARMRRGDPQPAAMGFHDRGADGQPHAHSTRFGRKEGLENTFSIGQIEAGAAILDGNQCAAIFAALRLDCQDTSAAGHRSHRFDGIHDEIQHDLLQLHLITDHSRNILVQFQL